MNDKIIKYLREESYFIKELHERTKLTLDDILNGNTTVRVPELMAGENVGDLPTVDFWGLTTSYEGLSTDDIRRIALGKAEHFEEVFYAALQVLYFNLNISSPVHQIVGEHLKLAEARSYRSNIRQGTIKANEASTKAKRDTVKDRRVEVEHYYFHEKVNMDERDRANQIAKDLSIPIRTVRRDIKAIKERRAKK